MIVPPKSSARTTPPRPVRARGVVCALRIDSRDAVRVQALAASVGKTRGYILRQAVRAGLPQLKVETLRTGEK